MKKTKAIALLIAIIILKVGSAQNKSVSIGTLSPDNSAVLDLESSTQGFLMTRLDSAQIKVIISPANGLIVFNTQDQCYWYKSLSSWQRICTTDSLSNKYLNTTYLKADTAIINYLTANYAKFDTVISKYISTQIIYGDTGIFNYLNVIKANFDTIISKYINVKKIIGDSGIFNYLTAYNVNLDTILNTYLVSEHIKADTVITNYISGGKVNLDSITNTYISSKTTKTDSLYVNGTPIQNLISDSINSDAWLLKGNSGTNPSKNFLGTKDNQDLVFRSFNTEQMRIAAGGNIGIGTTGPMDRLHITSPNGELLKIQRNAGGNQDNTFDCVFTSNTFGSSLLPGGSLNFMFTGTNNADIAFVNNTSSAGTPANVVNFIIKNSGFIGVGTYLPTQLFSVGTGTGGYPQFTVNADAYVNCYGGNAAYPGITFNGPANTGLFNDAANNQLGLAYAGLPVVQIDNTLKNVMIGYNHAVLPNVIDNTTNYGLTSAGNILMGDGYIKGANNLSINVEDYGRNVITTTAADAGLNYGSCILGSGNTITGVSDSYFFGSNIKATTKDNLCVLNPAAIPFTVLADNTFYAMFTQGYVFYTNAGLTTGVGVGAGGGSWASLSDRNLKENIKDIDYQSVLNKFCSLPINEWSYISQRPDPARKNNTYQIQPKHIGVMAQDFNGAFGYGEFDTRITDSDLLGVLSASVMALNEKTKKIDELEKQLSELKQMVLKLVAQK